MAHHAFSGRELESETVFGKEKEKDGKEGAFIEKKLLEYRTIIISSEVNRKLMEGTVSKLLLLEKEEPDGLITVFEIGRASCRERV